MESFCLLHFSEALPLDAFWGVLKCDTKIFTHSSHSHVSIHKPFSHTALSLIFCFPSRPLTNQPGHWILSRNLHIYSYLVLLLFPLQANGSVSLSSAYGENFPFSWPLKIILDCGYNVALSVFILLPHTEST